MIVDASNNAILEINTAALALLEESAPRVLKSNLSSHFDSADAEPVQTLLSNVRATGRDGNIRARLAKVDQECFVAVSQFRQENATSFLVCLLS